MSQTVAHLQAHAAHRLATALSLSFTEARLEANLLLEHLLNVNRAWLIAHSDEVLNVADVANFSALLTRRIQGEPIAYLLGYREFYGLTFRVTTDTLIPRPDTETLVEAALEKITANLPLTICDLGTGTGAIACAIAKHRPRAQVIAVDASTQALEVAQQNVDSLGLINVQMLHSDWLRALSQQKFDVIVSNPPYIEEEDPHLRQGDLRFEPLRALASGHDGLKDIRHIISQSPEHLNAGGWLLIEHGYNQAAKVADLFAHAGFSGIGHAKDLAGIQRVTFGQVSPMMGT